MIRRSARLAGLAAMLAALILAPSAIAAQSPGHPSAGETKKYAKLCGAKAKRATGAGKCIAALRKLAAGKSSSPRVVCAGLSHKRAKRERHSAFARCVKAASKLEKELRKAGIDAPAGAGKTSGDPTGLLDDDDGDRADIEPDDPLADIALDGGVVDDLPVIDGLDGPAND